MSYKYFLSITSQLPFCSTPIRLDAYNSCQFGCTFCFAKSRGGNIALTKTEQADAKLLSARLTRVMKGDLRSALDEFLSKRIPIQFGGMTDPFSPWEKKHQTSLRLLEVLKEFDYPTIISTKGTLFSTKDYVDQLRAGNFFVRVSATGADRYTARRLEVGVPDVEERLMALERLAAADVATSVRLQPIVPGQEEASSALLKRFAEAGVRHVSGEYLKLPVEQSLTQAKSFAKSLPGIRTTYQELGAVRVGREFLLPPSKKVLGHELLEAAAKSMGLVYGYADNEFLLRNRFSACCNASDVFLRDATTFRGNILGALKEARHPRNVTFAHFVPEEMTEFPLDNYLNSRSRPKLHPKATAKERWLALVRAKWNSPGWRGGPASYWMVEDTGKADSNGDKVYAIRDPRVA